MAKIIRGERVARQGMLSLGCSAVIFDAAREKILLTRRTDNGQWCLPGGRMEPGESAAEACQREVWEETGLEVRVVKLLGVYSDPNLLIEYADGNRLHIVVLNFEAVPTGGELRLSDETTDYGLFSSIEINRMDVMQHHRERIADAYASPPEAFIR